MKMLVLRQSFDAIDRTLARFPEAVPLLALRVALAVPFWRSGLTKWSDWRVSDSALYLFAEEFRLHVLGHAFAYPAPTLMAWAAAIAEIALPALLVLGLATRLAALGILIMTAIVQLTVPDGWAQFHLPWAAMALAIMTWGPGRLSLDRRFAVQPVGG